MVTRIRVRLERHFNDDDARQAMRYDDINLPPQLNYLEMEKKEKMFRCKERWRSFVLHGKKV